MSDNFQKVEHLCYQIKRQYPLWPSTFGQCSRECGRGKMARGSGLCEDCLVDELSSLVGERLSKEYLNTIKYEFELLSHFKEIMDDSSQS